MLGLVGHINCSLLGLVGHRDQNLRIQDDSGTCDSRKEEPETTTIGLQGEGARTSANWLVSS